ncbi:MAG: hypothetical protein O7G85_03555 [Planctomycetota bacterium]|nr:hypothetical protein [Planctomycetota bacterium]
MTHPGDEKAPKGDPYPLNFCAVSGEELGSMGDPIVLAHEGREIKLCCKGCVNGFKKDADKYIAKIDEAIVEQQMPYYPMDTCLVMKDEKLGSEDMGDPVNFVYKNRLVRFCCKGCVRKFKKNPADYLAAVNEAVIAKQLESYPLENCLVMEDSELGDKPVNVVFANRLVRFCCKGCIKKFKKNPVAYMAKLDAATTKD